jgi:hypothetical protein
MAKNVDDHSKRRPRFESPTLSLRHGTDDHAFGECNELCCHLRGSRAVAMMRSISTVVSGRFEVWGPVVAFNVM